MNLLKKISLSFLAVISIASSAQEFEAKLQLRPRFEYRNGYKNLIPIDEQGTAFISQRSRLNLNYNNEKLKTKITFQNIRTWGDAATTATTDKNGIAVFEAWAQYELSSNWSTRIGRQVISYDNQRIFGEIDWAQQGQSHDAALITFNRKNNQLDLGFALNSNSENQLAPKTPYLTNYKTMQYAWYHKRLNQVGMSLLLLNTGYEFQKTLTELEVDYKQTFGTYLTFNEKHWDINLGLYGQTGQSADRKVKAWYAGAYLGYATSKEFKLGLGHEILSGKDQNDFSADSKSFTPIFGTNHGFNGFMDYFYVGNHQNNIGLNDTYLKLNYTVSKWQLALIPHVFHAPNRVVDATNQKMDAYLGTEIDLTATYTLRKDIIAMAGYSQMFSSSTLERVKTVANAADTNNWVWVMLSISPRIFASK